MRVFEMGRRAALTAVVLAAWVACVGEDPEVTTSGPTPGTEGGSCERGGCLSGLSCVSNVCVRLAADGSVSVDATGPGTDAPSGDGSTPADSGADTSDDDKDGGIVAPTDEIVELSAGGTLSCVRATSGKVWCWGSNDTRQLATTDTLESCDGAACSWKPVLIMDGTDGGAPLVASAIAAGESFACAIEKSSSLVKCWGANGRGQLGHNESDDVDACQDELNDITVNCNAAPMPVDSIAKAKAISAGSHHACALVDKGEIWCWGENKDRQLGRTIATFAYFGGRVAEDDGGSKLYTSVRASGGNPRGHTCGVTAGTLRCWGSNVDDQLGRVTTGPVDDKAAAVQANSDAGQPLMNVNSVAAANRATCAVNTAGTIACRGTNETKIVNATADGGTTPFPALIPEAAQTKYKDLAGNRLHMCARDENDGVWCWGEDRAGQLGDGVVGPPRSEPQLVKGFRASMIDVGANTVAKRASDGTIWTWGSNRGGLLGHSPGTRGDQTCNSGPCQPTPVWVKLP